MKKFTALLLALALLSSMSALAEVCSEGEQVRPFRILSQTMVTGYPVRNTSSNIAKPLHPVNTRSSARPLSIFFI